MKKAILGAAVGVLAVVALLRFGPAVREWAEAKCQEMMARRGGSGRADVPVGSIADEDLATLAATSGQR
jgi:hypothetical protein